MMETVRTSEMWDDSNETTRLYIPEGSNLRTRRHENLKSRKKEIAHLSFERIIVPKTNDNFKRIPPF
jgi:hypothetical protein